MTEHDAQQVLLVRAIERQPASSTWTDEDRLHASQEALRQTGPEAERSAFVIERARLACERLIARKPAMGDLLHSLQWRGWFTPVALLVALLAGALLDSAGGDRINILNPPLLLIIAWNLFTYLVLAGSALVRALGGRGRQGAQEDAGRHHTAPASGSPSPNGTRRTASSHASRQGTSTSRGSSLPDAPDIPAAATGSGPFGALRRLVVRLATGQGWSTPAHSDDNLGARFTRQWFALAAPLYSQRALTLLHAGALMFATGALASLYLHGLVLEYRAGWESTFLVAPQVETLTHGLWGLASLLSGIALPDAAGLEAMRFPQHPGVNAAPWIHLQTLTVVLVVIIPRLLLALWHREQVRKLRTHFPLPLDDTYFRDLLRNQRGESATVWAQPYSYTLSDAARAGLTPLLTPVLGSQIRLRLQPWATRTTCRSPCPISTVPNWPWPSSRPRPPPKPRTTPPSSPRWPVACRLACPCWPWWTKAPSSPVSATTPPGWTAAAPRGAASWAAAATSSPSSSTWPPTPSLPTSPDSWKAC